MSSPSSSGALFLRVTNLLQDLARANRSVQVTATGLGQRLDVPAEIINPALVQAVKQKLLIPHFVDRCEQCGLETDGLLDDDESDAYINCLHCGPAHHRRYIIYDMSQELCAVAGDIPDTKAMRRRAPQHRQ